jgi:hypothetical protein
LIYIESLSRRPNVPSATSSRRWIGLFSLGRL